MFKYIRNFSIFIIKWFKHKNDDDAGKVTEDVYNARMAICNNCENKKSIGLLNIIRGPNCKICGCFIKEKTKWKFERCPADKPKWTESL